MPRPRKSTPSYLRHPNGQARICWTDPAGTRHFRLLPGPFNSPESLEAFHRLSLELAVRPEAPPTLNTGPTVAEILVAYLKYAEGYYDNAIERRQIKDAVRVVRDLYAATLVADFGPLALKACREAMIRRGWSRRYCNKQTNRVVRLVKWAAGEELVPATLYHALKTVSPLRAGKTDAPETEPRTPADPAAVDATTPHLPPHARALVLLIRLTGMRPSEACRMTLDQIDQSGNVWVYRPARHKNEHRGKGRAVHLGAAAQAVIVAHLEAKVMGPDDPLFSPRRQRDERYAAIRAGRKSKVTPSQVSRKKAKPKKLPGEWFTAEAVCHAVHKACEKAGVKPWSPYQLRHLRGAELREKFSLEHVRAALGHSHASMSAHYASGADAALAGEVAAKVG